ncbi:hypothetical protein [Ammoniphilus sp. 3BR4]|uniref:hypothetical protein n=1 Tax=Ammoniphilus sp. 3BR4 TaxID=3158265 RepID=UPI003464FF0E
MNAWLKQIPEPIMIQEMLQRIGAPATPEELGIDVELVDRSFREAYHLRDRYTVLRFINEKNRLE